MPEGASTTVRRNADSSGDPMPDVSPEVFRSALTAEARRRFGDERAEALAPDLETLAADLARVAAAPLPDDVEPGFFLVSE